MALSISEGRVDQKQILNFVQPNTRLTVLELDTKIMEARYVVLDNTLYRQKRLYLFLRQALHISILPTISEVVEIPTCYLLI